MGSISEIPSLGLQGFKGRSLVSCAALGLVLCNVLSPCSSGFSPHSCSSMTAEVFQLCGCTRWLQGLLIPCVVG